MTTAIEGLSRLTEVAKGSRMNENDDNKFPKLHVAGNRIFEGDTVYSQRTVDELQDELMALRSQMETLTAALEIIQQGAYKGAHKEMSEAQMRYILAIVEKHAGAALEAVRDAQEGG